jgi:hypothetical protein
MGVHLQHRTMAFLGLAAAPLILVPTAAHLAAPAHGPVSHGKASAIPKGTEVGVWGKTASGKKYSYTYVEGKTKPKPELAADADGNCTEYISDLTLKVHTFHWETEQLCWGAYGEQSLRTQIRRTSWDGWRGYTAESDWTKKSANSVIKFHWTAHCHHGNGTYDYEAVMQGRTTTLGDGPAVASGNIPRYNCGPED